MADELKDFHVVNGDLLVQGKVVADNVETRSGEHIETESEWEKKLKDKVYYDEGQQEVVVDDVILCKKNVIVDEGKDIVVGHDMIIDSLQNIQDPNGYAFIPDPSGHLKEALAHTTSGYAWYKGYELKGFEVVKKSVFENSFVYQTHTVYFVWNDTQGDHYGEVYVRYYEA